MLIILNGRKQWDEGHQQGRESLIKYAGATQKHFYKIKTFQLGDYNRAHSEHRPLEITITTINQNKLVIKKKRYHQYWWNLNGQEAYKEELQKPT